LEDDTLLPNLVCLQHLEKYWDNFTFTALDLAHDK